MLRVFWDSLKAACFLLEGSEWPGPLRSVK